MGLKRNAVEVIHVVYRFCLVLVMVLWFAGRSEGVEERIRGVLEKTAKPNACAQITDALNDIYYVVKTVDSEKACAPLIGQRVVLAGVVEERGAERVYFIMLKKVENYRPKQGDRPNEKPVSVPLPPAKKPKNK